MGSTSPVNPPWMSELVARNHKIIRSMWHSTESYLDEDERDGDNGNYSKIPSVSTSNSGGSCKKQVVEPQSSSMNVILQPGVRRTKMGDVVQEQIHRTRANKLKTSTEKSSPIREQGGFMGDGDSSKSNMTNVGETSILEYGPGIVRKLRSIYQSLAVRQNVARPSLWKSASMENVLDVDVTDGINGEQSPFEQKFRISNVGDKRTDKIDSEISAQKMTKSKSTTAVPDRHQTPGNETGNMYEKKSGPRGRAAVSERRDRMRRARSVDALQRTKHEEEILEKFKAVVLPKEEIVIIEVSKPRANLNGLGLSNNSTTFYLSTSGDKSYPAQLMISPDRARLGLAGVEIPQAGIRTRSFVSPEHELPPQDIVRETARIFEKNQENSKRLGQALRLSKSPTNSHPTSPMVSPSPGHADMPFTQKYDKGNSQTAKLCTIKQVGVIRPTVNTGGASQNHTDRKGGDNDLENSIVSPILNSTPNLYKGFLQQNGQKPALSPKPLFASSPKPSHSSRDAESPSVPTAFPRKFATSVQPADKKPADQPPVLDTVKPRVEPTKIKSVNVDNVASANKGRESVAEIRRPLKHVPKSFSIEKDEPFPTIPAVTNNVKSSPASNPTVKFGTSERNRFAPVTNTNEKITVTAKIVETPKPILISSSTENNRPSTTPVETKVMVKTDSVPVAEPNSSQLRAHQKQKSNQGSNSTMVFNFTGRSSVPDYIEDDGLNRGRMTLAGTVMDESVDDIDTGEAGNGELVNFVGANVIINGKSSIQKKPKSSKLCISFNEERSTYEYPSETSLLAEEENSDKDLLGHKGPNVINNNGSGLSSYTPRLANDYQLGNFEATPPKKEEAPKKEAEPAVIEDYLKPDSETTTWSNELTSDIMF